MAGDGGAGDRLEVYLAYDEDSCRILNGSIAVWRSPASPYAARVGTVGTERVVEMSDGTSIWSTVDGSGPAVVLCHGGPGLWDYLGDAAILLRGDFTVHRWDQRGCGRSGPAPPYGIDVALHDLQELKQAWGVDEAWAVVGHSWGAYLALLTALRHPRTTRALVYVGGNGLPSWWRLVGSARYRAERAARLSPAAVQRLKALGDRTRSAAEEIEFRRLSWSTDFADIDPAPAALEAMATTPLPINWEVNRALATAELLEEEELLRACERCEVPSLFLHGSADPRSDEGARGLADRMTNARFIEIEGAGHLPWVERPQEFAAAVAGFLSTLH